MKFFTILSKGQWISLLVLILFVVPWFFVSAIPQDTSYHNFVDSIQMLNVPNFMNVVSNLPFLIVGFWGVIKIKQMALIESNRLAYWIFFLGVTLVGFGSGYYHLNPNNQTLLWDRLPMTIGFMALVSIVVSEQVDEILGRKLLLPLLLLGAFSVLYWSWSEARGAGDLRLYGLVQFVPILLIPILLFAYQSRFLSFSGYIYLIAFYLLAKLFEHFDELVFSALKIISGHSLKHIAAAVGIAVLIRFYLRREFRQEAFA